MGERKIKVAFSSVVRRMLPPAGISFVLSVLFWKLAPLSLPVQVICVTVSVLFVVALLKLRFSRHMTVAVWTRLWGSLAPPCVASIVSLPYLPFLLLLFLAVGITMLLGLWAAYRFWPLVVDPRLHRARFARLDEMEPLFEAQPCSDGLVLGRVKQFYVFPHYVCIRPTPAKKEIGNSLIIAPTGGGKGNQIRGQIVAWEDSVIVNDPKGDLFLATAGYRAQLGPVYVIDPTRGVGHSYDPLYQKTEEGEYLTVARHLVSDNQDRDPYWAENASWMLLFLFQAARREQLAPLPYLRHMIRLGLPGVARRLHSLDPALATGFLDADIETANLETNRTLTSAWSTLTTRLTPFLTETLVRCFTSSDVTAETIMRGPKPVSVYLRLEEAHLDRLSPFVRIMVESLVKELITTWDRWQGKGCRKVLLSLDELGVTPLPSLAKYVATARSRDIIFQLYYQSPAQLIDNYGREKAQGILGNMDTKIFLRPNDFETARRIEDWLGRGSQFSQSIQKREGQETGEGEHEQAIPVMTAREIMEMPDHNALVFHRDFPPMKLHRLKWWQSELLRKRLTLPVPDLPALPEIPPLPEQNAVAAVLTPVEFIYPDLHPSERGLYRPAASQENTILDLTGETVPGGWPGAAGASYGTHTNSAMQPLQPGFILSSTMHRFTRDQLFILPLAKRYCDVYGVSIDDILTTLNQPDRFKGMATGRFSAGKQLQDTYLYVDYYLTYPMSTTDATPCAVIDSLGCTKQQQRIPERKEVKKNYAFS